MNYTICDDNYCKTSVVIKNNTAFNIEIFSDLFDDSNFSVLGIKFFRAKEVYHNKSFDNAIEMKTGRRAVYKQSSLFSPLEVKTYIVEFKREVIVFDKFKEYIGLVAIMNAKFTVDNKNLSFYPVVSKIGTVDFKR
jgi:hypothetical protein